MLASEFPGDLDIRVHVETATLMIRTADPRVAVSRQLLDDLCTQPHSRWHGTALVITGIDRDGHPCEVAYRAVGFDPTDHPEANEGGFHLLELVDAPSTGDNVIPTDPVELARIAYQAYGDTTDHKNFRGEPMSTWDDLGDRIQAAWIAAAGAAAEACREVS